MKKLALSLIVIIISLSLVSAFDFNIFKIDLNELLTGKVIDSEDPDTDRIVCLATQDQTPGDNGVGWSDDAPDGSLFDDLGNFGTPKCCGDDSNEYYFTQGEDACCDEVTDCVNYIGRCFDSDTGSIGWHCYNHEWSRCTKESDVGKTFGSYTCANDGGIKWVKGHPTDEFCIGNPDSCSTFPTLQLCKSQAGCKWYLSDTIKGYCGDNPFLCSTFSNPLNCESQSGCSWTTTGKDPDTDRDMCLSTQDQTPGDNGIGWSDDADYDFAFSGKKYNINYQFLHDANFDFVNFLWWGPPYRSIGKCERYYDALRQNGIGGAYIIYKYYDHNRYGKLSPLTRQQRINELRNIYNLCIKDSNLFAFVGFDEPSGWNYRWERKVFPTQESLTELKNGYSLVKEICPSCPVYGNYLVRILIHEYKYPEMVSKHLDATDIVSIDIYPFAAGAKSFFGDVDINSVAYTTERMKEMLEGKNKPFFVILAGINVTWTGSWQSYPSYVEMKNMAYQALMHGADGVLYFTFFETSVSQNVKKITNEIKLLEKVFLANTINKKIPKYSDYWPTKGYPVSVTKNPNVPNPEYLVKKYNNSYYLIILNNKNNQTRVNYVIKDLIKRTETTWKVQEIIDGVPSGAPQQLQNLKILLQEYEVKVYKIYNDVQKGASVNEQLTGTATAESCIGIVTACGFFDSESSCESQQGCSWKPTQWNCVGIAQAGTRSCNSRNTESLCAQDPLCLWDSAAPCTGISQPCSNYQTKQTCLAQYGCDWKSSNYIVGTSDDGHITINGEHKWRKKNNNGGLDSLCY